MKAKSLIVGRPRLSLTCLLPCFFVVVSAKAQTLEDALDEPSVTWESFIDGTANPGWFGQSTTTNDGTDAAQSHVLGDDDADTDDKLEVIIKTNQGSVDLAGTAGLDSVTGNGTNDIRLTGSLGPINTAIDGLTYNPPPGVLGTVDFVNILAADGGDGVNSRRRFDAKGIPVVIGADNDGDTLPNTLEGTLGTDPNNPNTDGDSTNDGGEFIAGTNPLDPNDDFVVSKVVTRSIVGSVGDSDCQINSRINANTVGDGRNRAIKISWADAAKDFETVGVVNAGENKTDVGVRTNEQKFSLEERLDLGDDLGEPSGPIIDDSFTKAEIFFSDTEGAESSILDAINKPLFDDPPD